MLRWLRNLLGLRSPSRETLKALEHHMRQVTEGFAAGIEAAGRRHAELLASGLTEEEARMAGLAEAVASVSPEALAYAEGVARRSFWALYEDDEEEDATPA